MEAGSEDPAGDRGHARRVGEPARRIPAGAGVPVRVARMAAWERRLPVAHAAGCAAAALAACMVTPLGWHAIAYPFGYFVGADDGSIAMMKKVIVEWTPI